MLLSSVAGLDATALVRTDERRIASCGDGIIQEGEDFDDGRTDTANCTRFCRASPFGDGYVNSATGRPGNWDAERASATFPASPRSLTTSASVNFAGKMSVTIPQPTAPGCGAIGCHVVQAADCAGGEDAGFVHRGDLHATGAGEDLCARATPAGEGGLDAAASARGG